MGNKVSFVYKNIRNYRIIMNLLYGFKYSDRFKQVVSLLNKNDYRIFELCFGDIYIANYCNIHNLMWMGIDINEKFIEYAQAQGFNAAREDVLECSFPESDVIIIVGSLYHFRKDLEKVFFKMLNSSRKIIISEPVKNISNNPIFGFLARRSANAGKGDEDFRYTESSFLAMMEEYKNKFKFTYNIAYKNRDIVVVIEK